MFKEIKGAFKISGENLKIVGKTFLVKRYEGGNFKYGDYSAHSIYLVDGEKQTEIKSFDTRYDGISTKKDEWVTFWKDYIEECWGCKLDLIGYEEKEVD